MYTREKLLVMLTNKKATIRYDACEWLRVSKESSPEVVKSLVETTHDEDKEVAERAKYALQADVHHQMAIKMGIIEPDKVELKDIQIKSTLHKESGRNELMIAVTTVLGLVTIFFLIYEDLREYAIISLFGMVFQLLLQQAASRNN